MTSLDVLICAMTASKYLLTQLIQSNSHITVPQSMKFVYWIWRETQDLVVLWTEMQIQSRSRSEVERRPTMCLKFSTLKVREGACLLWLGIHSGKIKPYASLKVETLPCCKNAKSRESRLRI